MRLVEAVGVVVQIDRGQPLVAREALDVTGWSRSGDSFTSCPSSTCATNPQLGSQMRQNVRTVDGPAGVHCQPLECQQHQFGAVVVVRSVAAVVEQQVVVDTAGLELASGHETDVAGDDRLHGTRPGEVVEQFGGARQSHDRGAQLVGELVVVALDLGQQPRHVAVVVDAHRGQQVAGDQRIGLAAEVVADARDRVAG
jgi:hypothetical protein